MRKDFLEAVALTMRDEDCQAMCTSYPLNEPLFGIWQGIRMFRSTKGAVVRAKKGFTLIELMIVVAIIAILTAIAYPSYVEHVRKERRAQAKADLIQLTQMLERAFTTDRDFTTFSFVPPLNQSPQTGTPWYDIVLDPLTATTYKLTATPRGDQLNDKCLTLSIDQLGTKGATGPLGVPGCW